ncbi:GmrSD restriction endonuclease domain-containing protein [Rothia halotolerans]|uniref:GmrSD restriction endonuclease domain-containing protein n=1 Tax=Rothia halotolerans TaxID=405770 RepID=UPI0013EAD98B|nr:DUF262 domain-containing protein [Rothia halotolerans]
MSEIVTRTRAGVYRIEDIVKLVMEGKLRVPEFQRNFRWSRKDVLELFDSILKGYPVGSLLLWRHAAPAASVSLGELHISAPGIAEATWVVDGQQRITAIANAVSQEAYDASEKFRIDYDLTRQSFVLGSGNDEELRVPLPVLFDLRRLLTWAQSRPAAVEYIQTINDIAVKLRDFSVPASIVDESNEDTLREIFDRTNNSGKKLRRAEVFHALFSEKHDAGLTIEAIADELESTGFGKIDSDTVLHAILARRHADFSRDLRQEFSKDRELRLDVSANETQEKAFQGGHDALRRAVTFLQEEARVPHVTFLPYKYLITTLARFFAHHPNPHPRNQDLLVRWFWRTALAPTLFSGSATAMGRGLTSRINPGDEAQSVQDLLSLVPDDFSFLWPDVNKFRTNTASTKIILCALYKTGPRRFQDGEIIDVTSLAKSLEDTQTAHDVVADIVPRGRIRNSFLARGAGGKFFLGDDDVSLEECRDILARNAPNLFTDIDAISNSHLVDEKLSAALREGRTEDFLEGRLEAIGEVVQDFLSVRMGLDFPSNPPLESYDLDDSDGFRDAYDS